MNHPKESYIDTGNLNSLSINTSTKRMGFDAFMKKFSLEKVGNSKAHVCKAVNSPATNPPIIYHGMGEGREWAGFSISVIKKCKVTHLLAEMGREYKIVPIDPQNLPEGGRILIQGDRVSFDPVGEIKPLKCIKKVDKKTGTFQDIIQRRRRESESY